jgi:CRP/FNR family cyclic AMP-dependent transcriptional regulator
VSNRPPSGVPGSPWPTGTLLARLPDDARQDLLSLGLPRIHPPGAALLRQGEQRTDVFLLRPGGGRVSACVKVTAALDNGTESLLEFMAFLERHPRAWEALCRMIAQRLDWANRRRLDYAGYGVGTRLARVLVELVDLRGRRTEHGHDLGVSLNQKELGMLIGARKDAVSKAMRDLETRGLVKCSLGYRAFQPPAPRVDRRGGVRQR